MQTDNPQHIVPFSESKADAILPQIALNGPFAMLVVDKASSEIIYINPRLTDVLGYTMQEIEDRRLKFTDLVEAYQKERLLELARQSTAGGELSKQYGLHNLKLKDGSEQMFFVFINPVIVNNVADAAHYHVVLLPEYSQQNLPFISFDSRELFLEQLNNIGFGTFEWIIETNKVYWSDGIYRIYDVDKNTTELSYELVQQFSHPDDARKAAAMVKRALENGQDYNLQMKIITARKNIKYISASGRLIKDRTGKPVKMVGCVMDITQQKQVEQNLSKNVKELNKSNKELEEFAYVASHDLQEPLRKISTFSDRLNEKYKDALDGDGAMYLERIIASAENMRSLIHNLLEFSRVAKDMEPFMSVNLALVLKEVAADLELPIEETGTKVLSNGLPVVEASFSQMKQLFTNVINNAIKFRKENRPPVITIEGSLLTEEEAAIHHLSLSDSYYKIQITDNGIGFDDVYATRIFQIFQRLHGKSEYPGSGIGLAICKKIIDNHQGIIYAENIPDQGARFTFIIPEKQN